MENLLVIVNIEREEPQTYVLFDEDNKKVVGVIIAEQCEDITDRVLLAISEDVDATKVTITDFDGEFDYTIKCDIIEIDEEDFYNREYSLYMTAKY